MRVIIRDGLQILGGLNGLSSPLLVLIYLVATLVAAMASYHYVELPGRALLREAAARIGKSRSVPVAVSAE
jgi:peptidoglycan/LPS O-acetylase OafA/YrhL